jgi:hypothetical protein
MPRNLATWEAEMEEFQFKTSLGKKLARLFLKQTNKQIKMLGVMAHNCNCSYLEACDRRMQSKASHGQKCKTYLKK